MRLNYLPLFIMGLTLLSGCSDHRREEQLAQREQVLIEKEKQFAQQEAEYRSLLRMRDSLLMSTDTAQLQASLAWPDTIEGLWNSRLVCTESACNEYVIGDQRTDRWEFTSDSTGTAVKVVNNNKLIRIFSGGIDGGSLRLHFATDSAAQRKVDMHVVLHPINANLLKGVQETRVNDNCTAKFSVELIRASNE